MSLFLEERDDGGFGLYLDGDLQFDTADEAIYHECLALPALCLARALRPESDRSLRALICGGGDGLALRECLRFPDVRHVDLVDYDPEVVALGRTRFAELNGNAFADPRAAVHIADAWDFLRPEAAYDVALCDFTTPRHPEEARVFTREWYTRIGDALAPEGVLAINGLSPQCAPEAFWCLVRTMQSAGLHVLPFRACIPSFRDAGYGVWSFFLAARFPLPHALLRDLRCPVPTRQADLRRLARAARFSRAERRLRCTVPVHTLEAPCLLPLLLNPGLTPSPKSREVFAPAAGGPDPDYDLRPLLGAIPVLHPYYSRAMLTYVAESVVGAVGTLDLYRLLDAILHRAAELPAALLTELRRLRGFLSEQLPGLENLGAWGNRLFCALVILMTIANTIAPDSAFGKGSFGLGHASVSRGYAGSFSGGRGFSAPSSRAGTGSFQGQPGFRGARSAPGASSSFRGTPGYTGMPQSFGADRVVTSGFRTSYGRGHAVDIYGNVYSQRSFTYNASFNASFDVHSVHSMPVGGGTHGTVPPSGATPSTPHQALFIAADDLLVLDNGDIVITLSPTGYLLVSGGRIALMSATAPAPLLPLYANPAVLARIREQLQYQQMVAQREMEIRRDWLNWVGWTAALFEVVQADRREMRSLTDLNRHLMTALERLSAPAEAPAPEMLPPGAVELFAECTLLPDGRITLRRADGRRIFTDGRHLWTEQLAARQKCPPELSTLLKGVLVKLEREFEADLARNANDARTAAGELRTLEYDLREYESIARSNPDDPNYSVDYGTDSVGVSDAIFRTQQEIQATIAQQDRLKAEEAQRATELERLRAARTAFLP